MRLKSLNIVFFILIISIIFVGCGNDNEAKKNNFNPEKLKEPLVKANKKLVKSEEEEIIDYIARYQWKMSKTETGLRYMIYKNGSGVKAIIGKIAKINFKVSLITGTNCYSSDETGPKFFLIGKGEVENGLDEGILFMKVGDKAKFIIPSPLAYGLVGDDKKIPKRATIIYDVELLEIK
jgi:FKBP-type peptidyl-prolyl cis-trans isomerase